MKKFTVDVIIPACKPDEKLDRLLDMLRRQTCPVHRILIVNTEEAYFHISRPGDDLYIEHIRQEEFDHGGTRHKAAMLSDADILVFMTQDAVPCDEYLIENLTAPFQDELVGAAYARQLPDKDCGELEKFTRAFNYPDKSRVKSAKDLKDLGIKTFFCSNVCAAYQKELYDSLGGFIRRTIFNEDMIFAGRIIKAGSRVAYAADARVIHSHNYSNMQQLRRNFDLAVSQKDNPDIFLGIKSEGEGIRLVLETARHCIKIRRPLLIPSLIVKSGFKYMGYKLGLHYDKLPMWLIMKLTMNKHYWM